MHTQVWFINTHLHKCIILNYYCYIVSKNLAHYILSINSFSLRAFGKSTLFPKTNT